MRKITNTLCLCLIFGCGPLYENRETPLLDLTGETLGLKDSAPKAPVISPAVANAQPGDLLLVTITGRGAVAALTKAQVNEDVITWISPGNVTMTFDRGVLIGTRGFNDDLMGADITGLHAALDADGGSYTRTHGFLDSEDQIFTREMTCTVTALGPEEIETVNGPRTGDKFTDNCTGSQLVFTNTYWRAEEEGEIIRSNQAVSAGVGFIKADQL